MITDGSAATTTVDRKMSLDSMGVDDLELLEMARQSACIADSANRNQFIGEEGGAGNAFADAPNIANSARHVTRKERFAKHGHQQSFALIDVNSKNPATDLFL